MYSIRIPYLEIPHHYYLLIFISCQIKYYAEIKLSYGVYLLKK